MLGLCLITEALFWQVKPKTTIINGEPLVAFVPQQKHVVETPTALIPPTPLPEAIIIDSEIQEPAIELVIEEIIPIQTVVIQPVIEQFIAEEIMPYKAPVASVDIPTLICNVFGSQCANAIAVANCESSLNPVALGDTSTEYASAGLFQIRMLPGRPGMDYLFDPTNNISYAYSMYVSQGWHPWSCARKLGIIV